MAEIRQFPGTLDVSVYVGDDWELTLSFVDAANDPFSVDASEFQAVLTGRSDVALTLVQSASNVLKVSGGELASRSRWRLEHVASNRTWLAGWVSPHTSVGGQSSSSAGSAQVEVVTDDGVDALVTVEFGGIAAMAVHAADSADVHGIADTSLLETIPGAQAKADAAEAAANAYTDTEIAAKAPLASPTFTGNVTVSGTVDGRDVATDGTKLDGIEAAADVTDATNVAAAGAVMESDTTTAAMSFVVDEDDMTSDSATLIPTQQSVKAYVDANAGGDVAAHEADTTSVHGIADTSALLDTSDIGSSVQAHSTVLDNTTASFTTADETKLDGIEAAADVTDATNVAAAGAHMAGGTDVPVADGGTGASTAADARTNLGLVIGTDVQAYDSVLENTTASFTTADETKLDGIETGATADQTAAEVTFTPTGDIAASDVQAAVAEVALERTTFVEHGATASTARPSVTGPVIWLGTVEPDNWTDDDIWIDTDEDGSVATFTINTVATTGATEDLPFASDGNTQINEMTMDQDCTFSFTSTPASGTLGTMTLLIDGAFTPTFPAAVVWDSGTAPTYATPSIYEFWTIDGGTTVYGHLAGSGMA